MWGGPVPLKKQVHALPEAVVPDAVDDDVAAAVSCQDPEGKEGKVAPGVSHHIAQHEHSDGGEGRCEGKRQNADCFGSFDVGEGRPVGASPTSCPSTSIAQTPLREQFAFLGVASDAGEGHNVYR